MRSSYGIDDIVLLGKKKLLENLQAAAIAEWLGLCTTIRKAMVRIVVQTNNKNFKKLLVLNCGRPSARSLKLSVCISDMKIKGPNKNSAPVRGGGGKKNLHCTFISKKEKRKLH